MAGPLNGIAGQQQVPLSQPYQPGSQNAGVREQREQEPRNNEVQPRGAAAAESQPSRQNEEQRALQDVLRETGNDSEEARASAPRGSVVDFTV